MNELFPADITVDNSNTESYFRKQVDVGLKELDEGKGIPHEEVEKRTARWFTEKADYLRHLKGATHQQVEPPGCRFMCPGRQQSQPASI